MGGRDLTGGAFHGPVLRVTIVGAGADKFTLQTRTLAERLIEDLLWPHDGSDEWPVLVSGHSPVGGVDIWAEECARLLAAQRGVPDASIIHAPRTFSWEGDFGFRERNLAIARDGDETHVVVVRDYPPDYRGRRFDGCYHCRALRPPHVKSGGCYTLNAALRFGKKGMLHILGGQEGYQRWDSSPAGTAFHLKGTDFEH